jgi:hypothetical protein
MSTGIQPRGEANTPRGMTSVIVLKAAKIVSRHCLPGDVIKIEQADGTIMPANDGLTEDFADKLVDLGIVKIHSLRSGDKPISVRPRPVEPQPAIESAQLRPQATAERAVSGRQKAAI